MKHVLSMLVENRQGVLARISGLLSGRGYNVESITAGITMDPTVSRLTLSCSGDDAVVEQIKKQLNRLIDVIKVTELSSVPSMNRELMLIKVNAQGAQRGEIFQVADVFKAQVMDVGHDTMAVELDRITGQDRGFPGAARSRTGSWRSPGAGSWQWNEAGRPP